MRIGRANGRLVIIDGDRVVDAAAGSDGEFSADPDRVFAVWDRFTEWAGGYAGPGAHTGPLVPGELGAPVLAPSQVFGIGLNYREHAAESGVDAPDVPPVFTKFRSCLAGPYATVELPSDRVDWEVELVAVIGRPAERVPEEKAWSYVAGVMVGQDLSERTVQLAGPVPQFSLGKSFPGFGPTGPWLVTPD
ncbi:MAG TPA: fumarylacetoacetate hydrolase family protein, partial [Streptosporangiaceae bacterium]